MASSGDTQVMIAEEVQSNSSFVWFQGEDTGWRVTAVCQATQRLFGIDIAAMCVHSISRGV